MSDPSMQAKSNLAQAKAVQKNVKSKFARVKGAEKKTASFDKNVRKHLLIFLAMGLLLGCSVFVPFFSHPGLPLAKISYASLGVIGLLLGIWSHKRAAKKIDWYEGVPFSSRFWLALGTFVAVYLGMLILYLCISLLTPLAELSIGMSFLLASAPLPLILPIFVEEAFDRATFIAPKAYELWMYPENYVEKQPSWNPERIVFANLHFKRDEQERSVTTVKVKLPKEAVLGELIYLFMRDYNENRSPDRPIRQLTFKEGVEGWMFKTNNKGFKAIFKRKRLLDTNLSIEENRIEKDQDLFFERVIKPEE